MMKYLCAGITAVVVGCTAAAAEPLAPAQVGDAQIIMVRGGCGIGFHRGPYGGCVPNRALIVAPAVVAPVRLPPPCPPGYYRDPRPGVRLCYPRF